VPQSVPPLQSAVSFGPYGKVPSPTSNPFERGSSTNAVMAAVALFQLSGLAVGRIEASAFAYGMQVPFVQVSPPFVKQPPFVPPGQQG
jgi:hypothetical protein